MEQTYSLWMNQFKVRFEEYLNRISDQADETNHMLWDAMRYSLLAGGKRLRPAFFMLTGLSYGAQENDLLPYAAALEMIHTYSLIHDDLPAMDNDDYRRGRLTNHKVYGEAAAILAGDGLLNQAAVIMSDDVAERAANGRKALPAARTMHEILLAAGPTGMIAGQIADIENLPADEDRLIYINEHKTSALLGASLTAGALFGEASGEDILSIRKAGKAIGQAFQIQDDILDVEGTMEALGKMPGSDALNEKPTYVTLYGLEVSRQKVRALTDEAVLKLQVVPGMYGDMLRKLTASLTERTS